MNPAWVSALVALIVAVGAVGLWVIRSLWRFMKYVHAFLDDWNGRPGDLGHAHQPGVMERLSGLEKNTNEIRTRVDDNIGRLMAQDQQLAIIRSEVTLNSGHSIKDTVQDILMRVERMQSPGGSP